MVWNKNRPGKGLKPSITEDPFFPEQLSSPGLFTGHVQPTSSGSVRHLLVGHGQQLSQEKMVQTDQGSNLDSSHS